MTRRRAAGVFAAGLWLALLAGCDNSAKWHAIDVSGSLPALAFTMTRASDGQEVTQADYRGKHRAALFRLHQLPRCVPGRPCRTWPEVLTRIGPDARQVRVLFVTVDPNRDTPPVLAAYVKNFAPQIEGLRGTADQLAALARRYRVVYSVTPATKDHPYEVTHSSAIYVFDAAGTARLIIASLSSTIRIFPGPRPI